MLAQGTHVGILERHAREPRFFDNRALPLRMSCDVELVEELIGGMKEIVAFGPRPIGSENHKKVENYILAHLKGDEVEQDAFEISPPEGNFPVRNIIAKFTGTKDGIIVIASHYDTNWPLRNVPYVGANDGASSSALLLEIANQLRGKKRDGYK